MTTIEFSKGYVNNGDIDWLDHGGLFVKHIRDRVYHVVAYDDISKMVDMETYIKVDDAHVDVSVYEDHFEGIMEDGGMEGQEYDDKLMAMLIFEQVGAFELGDRRDYKDKKEALRVLQWLVSGDL